MSISDKKASASRRPSLIDPAPSSPSGPRNATEPTRVLADLGGHKPPGISGGMITVACCIVAMGIGAGFWATSGAPKPVVAAAPPAVVASAPAPAAAAPASPPVATPSPAAAPVSAEAPKPTVPALTALNLDSATAAGTHVAKITDAPAHVPKDVAAASVAVAAQAATGASKIGSDKPRKVAAPKPARKQTTDKQARQPAHMVATRGKAHAPGKPHSTTVAKGREDKRRETSSAPATARKNTDPDTDLLAAMLRRNGGGPQ
ncbi:hypothetical protein [Variovorax rhizosphaerae]|uniref:Uncharacterized protein n=1 Tax=Variovorax rhizosphaerae TaxID=1836200 RepID=A0ABU8WFD8_9BURK